MILYLIRHGETTWNSQNLVQGWSESDLNEVGRRQAELVAQRLIASDHQPTAIYSSPLHRATQTAQPTAAALNLQPAYEDDLREMRCGLWEGLNFDDLKATRREEYLTWANSPDSPIPGGGESIRNLYDRASTALRRILDVHNDEDSLAIFTHGGVTRILLAYLLGIDLQIARRCYQDNATINLFVHRANMFFLNRWNDTSHLMTGSNGRALTQI